MIKSFKIDLDIYGIELIQEALEVFNEYGDIKYENGLIQIQSESENEIQEIFDEFCNYMLFINN